MQNKRKKSRAFTIVELVIVIAIIAILASVLVPTFGSIIEKANRSAAMTEANNAMRVVLLMDSAQIQGEEFLIVSRNYVFTYSMEKSMIVDPTAECDDAEEAIETAMAGVKSEGVRDDETLYYCNAPAPFGVTDHYQTNPDLFADVLVVKSK